MTTTGTNTTPLAAKRTPSDPLLPTNAAEVLASLRDAARTCATPFYLTDAATLVSRAEDLELAFPEPWVRQYSLKANDVPELVERLWRRGWGANVVSLGEWHLARAAGVPNYATTLEGIGKTDIELRAVAQAIHEGQPLRWISLESADEAEALASICRDVLRGHDACPDILLRLNPRVEPETIAGLAVGKPSSKFGMTEQELLDTAAKGSFADGTLRLRGVHVHVGSQLGGIRAWVDGAASALDVLEKLRTRPGGAAVDTIDFGGGFSVGEPGAPSPSDFAHGLSTMVRESGRELPPRCAIEPGRYVVADAGWIAATVLHVRERSGRQQVILDAGMTELMRPALYGAFHPVVPVLSSSGSSTLVETDVEGPVCESADSLGRHRLPILRRGDIVAIAYTGAYGSSLSSRYNGRSRPAEHALEQDGTFVQWRSPLPVT